MDKKAKKKYKYLKYVPAPVKLIPVIYDLVDDEEFCIPDGRIPLLIVTQFGIFPGAGSYEGKKDYRKLEGLDNQIVGFILRGYCSDREHDGILELFLDSNTLQLIRRNVLTIETFLSRKANQKD